VKKCENVLKILAALLIVPVALAQATQAPAAPKTAAAPGASPAADQKLVAFAREIEKGLAAGKAEALDSRVDAAAIADAATARVSAPPQAIAGFKAGVTEQFSIGTQLVRELKAPGASYKFLRLKRADDETRALFRLLTASGLNYHELTLRTADAQPRVTDIHVYITGESMSQSLRRAFLQQVMSVEKGQDAGQTFAQEMEKVRQMSLLAREGKSEEAMKVYDSLSPKTQGEKIVQVTRVSAAARLDPASYTKVLDDYRKRFKNDPTLDLISVDAHLLRGEEKQAMAAIDRIDKAVGGDPYLDVMRGTFYLAQNQPDKAKALCQKAVKAEPGLFQGYDTLLTVSLKQQDHPETARLLAIFEDKFGLNFGDGTFANAPDFKPFTQSESFKTWRQRKAGAK